MAKFRVPYPADPVRRKEVFDKGVAALGKFGKCEGTPDIGVFQGSTPLGDFAGRYISEEGSAEIEVEILKKPFLVPIAMIESEARKFVNQA